MELVGRTNAVAVGKSLYVLIPVSQCKILGIEKGVSLKIYKNGNQLIYEKDGD